MEMSDYIRVTDVLYPFSGIDKIDPMVLRKAADRGSEVHRACDSIIQGLGEFSVPLECEGYLKSFRQWYDDQDFLPKVNRFFCENYMITGECDGIYIEGEDVVLVDFKTSVKESKTWQLQGSAYSYLAKRNGIHITRIEFVKLDKKGGKPKVFTYSENFGLFVECLDVYRYFFKNREEGNVLDYL